MAYKSVYVCVYVYRESGASRNAVVFSDITNKNESVWFPSLSPPVLPACQQLSRKIKKAWFSVAVKKLSAGPQLSSSVHLQNDQTLHTIWSLRLILCGLSPIRCLYGHKNFQRLSVLIWLYHFFFVLSFARHYKPLPHVELLPYASSVTTSTSLMSHKIRAAFP